MSFSNSRADSSRLKATQLLTIERLCDQFEEAWCQGNRPLIQDYLQGLESTAVRAKLLGELIAADAEFRRRIGEIPAAEDYLSVFPEDGEVVKAALNGPAAEAQTFQIPRPTAILEVIDGPHRGLRYVYDRHDTLLVGRGNAATLQLIDDPNVSRHHFLLEFNPPLVFLRDLGSSNGTLVNGKPARECFLSNGDEICSGKTRIRVTLPAWPEGEVSTADVPPEPQPLRRDPAETRLQSSDSSSDPLPSFIPGYEVLYQLGAGGMGSVYLARSWSTGGEFALKLMLPESAVSERAMRLFLREVSVLSNLEHPNVVRYHEMGTALGQFYFVMEYVPSTSLTDTCRALAPEKRVPFVCTVAAQALEGLAYAHAKGFIHRDVKPANILVNTQAPTPRVKVSDFGLAKSFQNAGFSGMTMSGQVMGTLAFMAPEQLTNCRTAKPAADLYSIGATIYTLLAGCFPLDVRAGRDPVRVLLEDEPPPLDSLCPWLPRPVTELTHRALNKRPEERFESALAMRSELLPFVAE